MKGIVIGLILGLVIGLILGLVIASIDVGAATYGGGPNYSNIINRLIRDDREILRGLDGVASPAEGLACIADRRRFGKTKCVNLLLSD